MTITEIIEESLQNTKFQKQLSNSFSENHTFECSDCTLDETLFIKFLKKCKWNRNLYRIFENIDYLIINKKNVTDKVFQELVKMAKTKRSRWLWVSLTHANLNDEQQAYLRSLPFLNEAVS